MDLSFVERMITLLDRSTLVELDCRDETGRLRLIKHATTKVDLTVPLSGAPILASPPTSPVAESAIGLTKHLISAGIFGVFYSRPSADEPPFIEVGDLVSEGQTLGVMEAMKVFVPIEADRAGRITNILQDDGAAVEIGTPLFSLDPTD